MKTEMAAFGLFSTQELAQKAIESLMAGGFKRKDISVILPRQNGAHDFVHGQLTKLKTGVVFGASAGLVILGAVGFFIGLNSQFSLSPNGSSLHQTIATTESFVPVFLITTFLGLIAGVLFGGACGALVGIGIPNSIGKRYSFYLKEGGTLIKVHINEPQENQQATEILMQTGAQDVAALNEHKTLEAIKLDKKTSKLG